MTKILVFIDWYLPGYKAGGPIRSVANMVEQLSDKFQFHIVTSNKDLGDETGYTDTVTEQWVKVGKAEVMYCEEGPSKKRVKKIVKQLSPDFVYFNSFFSFKYTISPLSVVRKELSPEKIILAPRGMLGVGALALKSKKKKAFLKIARIFGLYSGIKWHASTENEAQEISAVFGEKTNVSVAKNLTASINVNATTVLDKKNSEEVSFVFVSRVSPKKNVQFLCQLFADLKVSRKVSLAIYGPIEEEGYWQACQALLKDVNENITVSYGGVLLPEEVNTVLQKVHYFILPTLNENFGHAIFEAWANGCPVVISDQTPWKALQEKKIGIELPLDMELWKKEVTRLLALSESDYAEMVVQSIAFAKNSTNTEKDVAANVSLFS